MISDVVCSGSENELSECSSADTVSCLPRERGAGVVCQSLSTMNSACSDGDIRLVNGTTILEGRVEICLNDAWGTVCGGTFSEDEASVICDQTGYRHNGKHLVIVAVAFSDDRILPHGTSMYYYRRLIDTGSEAFRDAHFGEGTGPIFLERYDCSEGENRFLDCALLPIGVHSCDHSNDAGVRCIGE